jgi:hypothetical protein
VNRLRPKRPRIRLQGEQYTQLCRQVLERDNWRCQNCGRTSDLQVHHIGFRSSLGDDSSENLLTLCFYCHRQLHTGKGTTSNLRIPQLTSVHQPRELEGPCTQMKPGPNNNLYDSMFSEELPFAMFPPRNTSILNHSRMRELYWKSLLHKSVLPQRWKLNPTLGSWRRDSQTLKAGKRRLLA